MFRPSAASNTIRDRSANRTDVLRCILYATALEAKNGVGLCREWGEAREVGQLDSAIIPEASGMGFSSDFRGRLYGVDDSSTRIHVTDAQGNPSNRHRSREPAEPTSRIWRWVPAGKQTVRRQNNSDKNTVLLRDDFQVIPLQRRVVGPASSQLNIVLNRTAVFVIEGAGGFHAASLAVMGSR